jgi:hypothetical protein
VAEPRAFHAHRRSMRASSRSRPARRAEKRGGDVASPTTSPARRTEKPPTPRHRCRSCGSPDARRRAWSNCVPRR